MFFILSKVLLFLVQPFNWLLLLALAALLARNTTLKRRLWIACGVLFLIFSNPWLIEQLTQKWQAPERKLQPGEVFEAGILLSGFTAFNQQSGNGYFQGAGDRFIQAVRLYHTGHLKRIVVSGGNSSIRKDRQAWKEADFVAKQLVEAGVPDSVIVIENNSRNTYENGLYSKAIINRLGIRPPYLLITSATHMRRSQEVFAKLGLPTTAYPCHFTVIGNKASFPEAIVPAYKAFELWDTLLKEIVGLYVYRLTGKA
jgi:uncharacterized SAM-binding protein YcdF (DUF218 family)